MMVIKGLIKKHLRTQTMQVIKGKRSIATYLLTIALMSLTVLTNTRVNKRMQLSQLC